MPLLPLRRCSDSTALSGSLAMSAAFTSRCSPLSTSVTTMAPRRAARSALRAVRSESFIPCSQFVMRKPSEATPSGMTLIYLFHQHADLAATGEADLPGGLIGDAEFQHFGFAGVDHIE